MNNLKSILYIYLSIPIFFFGLYSLNAQPTSNVVKDVVLPPPNAASLGKYGDIPVDYASGLPNINVPIHTIQDGPLSLNIALNYHASGIRVAETASWVGLGWSLSAGGMISRTVMGAADESPTGYWFTGNSLADDHDTYCAVGQGAKDGEPDIFSFNLPTVSGKFFFDKDHNIQIIPEEYDLKIERSNTSNIFEEFIITTADGTRYIFGKDQNTGAWVHEYMKAGTAAQYWRTSWLLTRIETHDENYYIDFNYTNETYNYKNLASCNYTLASGGGTTGVTCPGSNGEDIPKHKYIHHYVSQGKRLTSITNSTNTETISFVANTTRSDLNGSTRRLDAIEIATGSFCSRFNLTYGEFFDNQNHQSYNNRAYFKRLRLDKVQEFACSSSSINKPPYQFTYEGPIVNGKNYLPHRLSKAFDHWGYYNGEHGNEGKDVNVPSTSVTHPTTGTPFTYGSAKRDSKESFMKYGVIKRITYPTGGYTDFTFEGNTAKLNIPGSTVNLINNLTTCGTPGSACCGNLDDDQYITLTSAQLGAKFDLEVVRNPYPPGIPGGCTSSYTYVKIEIFQGSTLKGSYGFNVATGQSFAKVTNQPLSQIATALQSGVNYRFKISSTNGKGTFNLHYTGSTLGNKVVGGLRAQQIRTHDDFSSTSNDIIKTFDYKLSNSNLTSGLLLKDPIYGAAIQYHNQTTRVDFHFTATTPVPLSNYDGRHLLYPRVTEHHNGNGKVVYEYFTDPTPTCMNRVLMNHVPFQGLSTTGASGPPAPYLPELYKATNGKLKKQTTYNATGNIIATKEIFAKTPVYTYAPGFVMKVYLLYCSTSGFGSQISPDFTLIVDKCVPRTGAFLVDKIVETVDGITTTTQYTYDYYLRHHKPTYVTTTHSDGSQTRINNRYTYEYLYGNYYTPHTSMINRNIVVPVRVYNQSKIGGSWTTLSGSISDYAMYRRSDGLRYNSTSGTDPRLWRVQKYNRTWTGGSLQSGSWSVEGVIDQYHPVNSAGKAMPWKFTKTNWNQEQFEWQNGLIKKRTFKDFIWEYTYYTGTKLVSSIKAVDGQLITYNYDALKRLSSSSERNGNIVTDYTYQYKANGASKNSIKTKQTFGSANYSSLRNLETIEYMDGLGRPIQTVKVKYAPNQRDVVTSYKYDKQGRKTHEYTPYQSPYTNGSYFNVPTNHPHTFSQYYDSPLNRIHQVTPPDWYASTYSYGKNNSTIYIPASGISYSAGELFVTKVEDPENRKTITYKDSRGRTILSKIVKGGQSSSTYSIYDEKDRLAAVLPPGTNVYQTNLIYRYEYDGEDQLISKKVPDAGIVLMKYNNKDLLTLTQDANMSGQNKWLLTKYDDYGRSVQTGFYSGSNPNPNTNYTFSELLTETCFDGKNCDGTTHSTSPIYKGKIRETRVKVLDNTNTWIYNQNVYDSYGRVYATFGNNHVNTANGSEYNTYQYDFADNQTYHYRRHRGPSAYYYLRNKDYFDHSGRAHYNLNYMYYTGLPETQTYKNVYNYRDEVATKYIGKTGSYLLQKVDYTYNAQGWLEKINTPSIGGGSIALPTNNFTYPNPTAHSNVTYNDLYYLELKYDQLHSGVAGTAQKDGNIAQMISRVRGRERLAFSYNYDYLGRMTSATDYRINDLGNVYSLNRFASTVSYDQKGNITTLNRRGAKPYGNYFYHSNIDQLSYTYHLSSNKIKKITDNAYSWYRPEGFKPGGTGDYTYDANGNMTFDPNKNITIEYNHLNLPKKIDYGGGKRIEFLYDADGNKLRKKVFDTGSVLISTRDYLEQFEYNNNKIESVFFENGRLYNQNVNTTNTALNMRYEYVIRDHLGNNQLAFTDKDNDGKIEVSSTQANNEILTETHYYPFGMAQNGPWMNGTGTANADNYKFNNKELNEDFGLGWYDFGNRWQDPSIGRFTTIDRFSDKFNSQSPYTVSANNPIKYIDINGDSTYLVIYGSGWYRPQNQGQRYDVGDAFKESAEAQAENIRKSPHFDPTKDDVVVVYAPTEQDFLDAVNKKYSSGDIVQLDVYSHGTGNTISLGGEATDLNSQQDKRWIDGYDSAADANSPGENEIAKMDANNFTSNATCTLWGCNLGGSKAAWSSFSPAQRMADHLGGNRTVRAFVGGGGAEFKQKNGRNIYDGTLIRSADRKSQKVNLTTFKKQP